MRKCPKCGCTVYTGTQERKHQVILYGNGVFIRDSGELHGDPIQGPYTCMQCGTEYGSLDDLTEEVGYDSLKVGNLVLAHSMGLPEGTVRANLEKTVETVLSDCLILEPEVLEEGFYCFRASSSTNEGDYPEVTGGIIVKKAEDGTATVHVLPDPNDNAYTCWISIKTLYGHNLRYGGSIEKGEDGIYILKQGYPFLLRSTSKARIISKSDDFCLLELVDLNEYIRARLYLSVEEYEKALVRYEAYDPVGLYSEDDLKELYVSMVSDPKSLPYDSWKESKLAEGTFKKCE